MVDPEWQGMGLGQVLQTCIMEYAQAHGVRGFTADVLADNARMLGVFRRSGCEVTSRLVDGAFEVRMLFVQTADAPARRAGLRRAG